jgi:hypothetical protein
MLKTSTILKSAATENTKQIPDFEVEAPFTYGAGPLNEPWNQYEAKGQADYHVFQDEDDPALFYYDLLNVSPPPSELDYEDELEKEALESVQSALKEQCNGSFKLNRW